jgi:hypothetical protein
MLDTNIAADTELGQRAIDAVEQYVKANVLTPLAKEDNWPIARAQIAGLRQIAANEPAKVGDFTEHQRSKAAARLETVQNEARRQELEAEIAFWELVRGLCEGKPPRFLWSLAQACTQAVPPALTDEKLSPGAKPAKDQQAARKQRKDQRDRWEKEWKLDHYAAFFQRFCAHYLYEMSKRTQGE